VWERERVGERERVRESEWERERERERERESEWERDILKWIVLVRLEIFCMDWMTFGFLYISLNKILF
jgi:hypothetical protein